MHKTIFIALLFVINLLTVNAEIIPPGTSKLNEYWRLVISAVETEDASSICRYDFYQIPSNDDKIMQLTFASMDGYSYSKHAYNYSCYYIVYLKEDIGECPPGTIKKDDFTCKCEVGGVYDTTNTCTMPLDDNNCQDGAPKLNDTCERTCGDLGLYEDENGNCITPNEYWNNNKPPKLLNCEDDGFKFGSSCDTAPSTFDPEKFHYNGNPDDLFCFDATVDGSDLSGQRCQLDSTLNFDDLGELETIMPPFETTDSDDPLNDDDGGTDGGTDTDDPLNDDDGGTSGGTDGGTSGGSDSGTDGGTSGGSDSGTDGGTSGGSDSGTDGGGTSGGTDDGGSDGGTDGGGGSQYSDYNEYEEGNVSIPAGGADNTEASFDKNATDQMEQNLDDAFDDLEDLTDGITDDFNTLFDSLDEAKQTINNGFNIELTGTSDYPSCGYFTNPFNGEDIAFNPCSFGTVLAPFIIIVINIVILIFSASIMIKTILTFRV